MTTKYNPVILHRQSVRLKGYDYAQAGAYFVTICTRNRECLFGDIVDNEMQLSQYGLAVREEWLRSMELRQDIEIDTFVIMPNHVHGIIVINGRGTARRAPTYERFGKPVANSIPTIIRAFKSASTKRINEIRSACGIPVWQRNYYEHVIRNEKDMDDIRQYVLDNPACWADDENHPDKVTRAR